MCGKTHKFSQKCKNTVKIVDEVNKFIPSRSWIKASDSFHLFLDPGSAQAKPVKGKDPTDSKSDLHVLETLTGLYQDAI